MYPIPRSHRLLIMGRNGCGRRLTVVGHGEDPCAMQAIRVMPNGVRMAASDTRRDGSAGAY